MLLSSLKTSAVLAIGGCPFMYELCFVEPTFKFFHFLYQLREGKLVSENHGRAHAFVVSFPCAAYILTRNKDYATANVWRVVHSTDACEYFTMMANSPP